MSTPMLAMLAWEAWRIRVGPCSPLPAHLIRQECSLHGTYTVAVAIFWMSGAQLASPHTHGERVSLAQVPVQRHLCICMARMRMACVCNVCMDVRGMCRACIGVVRACVVRGACMVRGACGAP